MLTSLILVSTLGLANANANADAVDFDTEVMPILTKAGCNAGACHGAAVGRGGFRLSLYGGDPAFDHDSIVRHLKGRRVNLPHPSKSLLLLKPTGRMEHGGGERLVHGGDAAKRIETWISHGAKRGDTRRLTDFDVGPRRSVLTAPGTTVSLRAEATFSDGSTRDVTRWTVFTPADAEAVAIDDETGKATVKRRGQNVVIARYLDRVVPLQLTIPFEGEAVDLRDEPRGSFIDEHVFATLATLRLPPSPAAEDATFLRRARLDLTGRLPTPKEVGAFLADDRPGKRAALIDRLLASEDFIDYWTYKLAELLRIRAQPKETAGAVAFHTWVRTRLAEDASYDAMARSLVLATGDTHTVGPANFYRVASGAREQAEYFSELFMGVRLRCANCHNHPLDQWTQDDYHGLAAMFAGIERGRHIRIAPRGEVTHPRTGEAAVMRIPGSRFLPGEADGREALAAWLTDGKNPYFAKAIVNRLWKAMMGRGLIEPVDDLSATNPATHPELLNALADDFIKHGFRIRHTLRRIATSAAYGRSAAPRPRSRADDRYYSHALAQPLEAEVLADAIVDVTGVGETYGDQPPGTRAIRLVHPGVKSEALDILGRCDRQGSCDSVPGGAAGGGLSKKLHLINGPLINRKIASADGRLRRMIDSGASNADIVTAFYLRALGREPSRDEQAHWARSLSASDQTDKNARRQALEDFVWGLLNCREFTTK